MDIIEIIGNCPPGDQPASQTIQNCLVAIQDITRIVFKDPNGAEPFNDDGIGGFLADAAALKTAIEDKTVWDAAIIAAAPDGIMLTPEIHDAQKPKQLIEPIELPNGKRILPGTIADQTSTYTLYGINSDNHIDLMKLIGLKREFLLIDKSGDAIYKNLTDAEVAAGGSPWFDANLVNVSTRAVETGAGNTDNIDIQLFTTFGDLDRFTKADTSDFGLIL